MTQANKIAVRRCASSATLQTLKDVTPELAAQIRQAWQTVPNRRDARMAIDRLFGTHGVEHLGMHKRHGAHVYYCNAGDTYAPTILFCGPRMFVSTYGDLVERGAIREEQ